MNGIMLIELHYIPFVHLASFSWATHQIFQLCGMPDSMFLFLADFTITVCCLCVSVPLCTGQFLMHMLHLWHTYAHQILGIYAQFVGIFVSGTFLAVTG